MAKIIDKTIFFHQVLIFSSNIFNLGLFGHGVTASTTSGGIEYFNHSLIMTREAIKPFFFDNQGFYYHRFICLWTEYKYPPWPKIITIKKNDTVLAIIDLVHNESPAGEGKYRILENIGPKTRVSKDNIDFMAIFVNTRRSYGSALKGARLTRFNVRGITCPNDGEEVECIFDLVDDKYKYTDVATASANVLIRKLPIYPYITSGVKSGATVDLTVNHIFTCNTSTGNYFGSGYFYWEVLHDGELMTIYNNSTSIQDYQVVDDDCGNTTWSILTFKPQKFLDDPERTTVNITCVYHYDNPEKYETKYDKPKWRDAILNIKFKYPPPGPPYHLLILLPLGLIASSLCYCFCKRKRREAKPEGSMEASVIMVGGKEVRVTVTGPAGSESPPSRTSRESFAKGTYISTGQSSANRSGSSGFTRSSLMTTRTNLSL